MRYINPKMLERALQKLRYSPYFVDKTGLVSNCCNFIDTQDSYLCVTRPRRFGKTVNAKTLGAFLSKGLDIAELFEGLEVTKSELAMQHMGTHDVIYIDFSCQDDEKIPYSEYVGTFKTGLIEDLVKMYPDAGLEDYKSPQKALNTAFEELGQKFCFVIDEWDSMLQSEDFSVGEKRDFLKFLKQLLKDKPYVEFAYMTGIMSIAKHSSGSELNMFTEFSAVKGSLFDDYFGFSRDEVRDLCHEHSEICKSRGEKASVNYDDLEFWYDGYLTKKGKHIFNPRSVVLALKCDEIVDYWTDSGPNIEVYDCIKHNIADVRDDISRMVSGESVRADIENFAASDMTMETKDEIFSAMVVYGLLTYYDGHVSIPNYELMLKFERTLKTKDIGYVSKLASRSEQTLRATIEKDSETVAQIVEAAHDQEIPLLRYKNEADLAALINLVYLSARNVYHVEREKSAGKGVADVSFAPINPTDLSYPPFIVELKVADDSETADDAATRAIDQIKQRDYLSMFNDALTDENKFDNPPLAVAISWDPKDKKHACRIEELA